ncbi:lipoate--protein ligase family protein [Candidatus Bathyarchaeota archaeon]|nr:lipoate--protein ligase family protein [Candidatus Bathyarchaeota archaeon]
MKEALYKATKGLIRVRLEMEGETVKGLEISGDFFMYPEDMLWELERFLIGKRIDTASLVDEISGFYGRFGVESPGVVPEDFAKVILLASES